MSWIFLLAFFGLVVSGVVLSIRASESTHVVTLKPLRIWLPLSVDPLFLWISFVSVDAGTVAVVTRNGSATRVLEPGGHFITPFIEQAYPVSSKTLAWRVNEDAASSDLQVVHTEVTVTYHFDPQTANDLIAKRPLVRDGIEEFIKAASSSISHHRGDHEHYGFPVVGQFPFPQGRC